MPPRCHTHHCPRCERQVPCDLVACDVLPISPPGSSSPAPLPRSPTPVVCVDCADDRAAAGAAGTYRVRAITAGCPLVLERR